ncbi:MAG: tetratricopeptide repeat protein [Acidobacteria bacterium]|nr:tetratricopeptide repeat protein [Acidobacteriota bacterium]
MKATRRAPPAANRRTWGIWLLLPALLLVTLAAYHPAWHGGMLWDDDGHITRRDLRSTEGLGRIWFEMGATQQYYPVVHSAFWLQHRLWGDDTFGYHLVNIILHALSAFLLALTLRRLAVPGAVLAAFLFALHPVHVESVAWITELKNTLSGALYLGAALAYLHFDHSRRRRVYALAAGLFVLGLLSKTVTATLPAALLVVFWWQRGQLTWRRDVVPLLPWFGLGAAGGLLTAWIERTLIGAQGIEFQFTLVERCLIAGRVVWFYLAKLLWPADLIFSYPRWQIDQTAAWQYLYPLGVVVLLAALWLLRRRTRAPLAAMLLFVGTLFPVLGFFNVYPFRYSLVADHFQYLPSLFIIAVFAAGVAEVAGRWKIRNRPALAAAGMLMLVAPLGCLTWSDSGQYANAELLYRTTLERNPASWLAYNNLGALELRGGISDIPEAMRHVNQSLKLNPTSAEALNNLGYALQRLGRFEEAMTYHQEALRRIPRFAEACNNLGVDLQRLGRLEEAESRYREALAINPFLAEAHHNLGDVLRRKGKSEEALAHAHEALRIDPDYADARDNLGNVLQGMGKLDEAVTQYQAAIRLKPDFPEAHNNLGVALSRMGRVEEALAEHEEALRLKPDFADAHYNRGNALRQAGRIEEAVAEFREALRIQPGHLEAHNNLGTALESLGRFDEALAQYREALELAPGSARIHDNVGYALLRTGRVEEAVIHFREAQRIQPDYAPAHHNLGSVLYGAGRFEAAVAQYREALRYDPGSAETHNNLGVALERLGRLAEAMTHFEEAVRLKPGFTEARANLSRAMTALKR